MCKMGNLCCDIICRYELREIEDTIYVQSDFEEQINLGSDRFYYVFKEEQPYLCVEVDRKRLFDDAVIHNNYLLIGTFENVYFINLDNIQVNAIDIEMYFGYFVFEKDRIFVLDGTGIIAFDENLSEIWRNHNLAVDGVTFDGFLDEKHMKISCEMNPPGGWVDRVINIDTGKLCV